MKRSHKLLQIRHAVWAAAAALICVSSLRATTYELSLPQYQANAGQTIRVPIRLNDATGLARVRIQINFDEQVAEFVQLVEGALGSDFDLVATQEQGVLTIDGTRAEALTAGNGVLAWIDFELNPGATTEAYTDLAVAQFDAGDETGVTDLAASNALEIIHGSITLTINPNIDNSGNRLPDWWEVGHGLDPYTTLAEQDDEGDGLSLLAEYAFGGNPWVNDAASLRGNIHFNASDYLLFSFRRRTDDASLTYTVWESGDLTNWTQVDQNARMSGAPVNLGGNVEEVNIRSAKPMSDPTVATQLFMRLEVER